jgi:hypothetical protein
LQESSAPRADERNLGYFAIPQAWFSAGDAKPVRDLMRDLEKVNAANLERTVFSIRIDV